MRSVHWVSGVEVLPDHQQRSVDALSRLENVTLFSAEMRPGWFSERWVTLSHLHLECKEEEEEAVRCHFRVTGFPKSSTLHLYVKNKIKLN